jgi:hypothetical protein
MMSDFIVQHPSGPFFQLDEKEWANAIAMYPDLLNDSDVRFEDYSATASAHLGSDSYFDNNTILNQFERLFKLLKFKIAYRGHDIEVLVDNARTHSAKDYSIHDFGKTSGTRCPVASMEYTDEMNRRKTLDCYHQTGPKKGQSKGLYDIAIELGFRVSSDIRLDDLKSILSRHNAFRNVSDYSGTLCISIFSSIRCHDWSD